MIAPARTVLGFALLAACAAPRGATGGERVSAATTAQAAPLRRQAAWGFRLSAGERGPVVRAVDASSAAARAGVREGDTVLGVNGRKVTDLATLRSRGGDRVTLSLARGSERPKDVGFVLDALPLERFSGLDVAYGDVVTERGHRLRSITTRPAAAHGPLPAIFFVSWLSCDSVEAPLPTRDGMLLTNRVIAERSGMVFMRVERPGLGDSEGPDCGDATLGDDLAGFREGMRRLRATPGVDPKRIFLVGASIGGGFAPVLAQDGPVRGVVAIGGFTKTWYEHMLEIERRRLVLEGKSPSEVNAAMRGLALFYGEYLNLGRTPREVASAHPDLAPLWSDEPTRQYGRPAAYYQAVQRLNVEAAWSALEAPALLVWGEYDWIMSKDDQERAVTIVNARHPGAASLMIVPRTGHGMNVFPSLDASFHGSGGTFDDAPARAIADWLRSHAE
jgi:pimeloyl-ACP methyl ester carboxylesterase